MELKTRYATYKDCYLTIDRYVADKSPAIQIWNAEDGPIAKLTVCLDAKELGLKPNESFVDVNNLPEAIDFIREYKLGELTEFAAWSGFCRFPLVAFNMDEIDKYK